MKLSNIIVLGGLGAIAYMIYQKSKTPPTMPEKANTLQVETKPSSDPNSELPVSEDDMHNEELLSPPARPHKEQMTDVVMGGGKMCFNAMKF